MSRKITQICSRLFEVLTASDGLIKFAQQNLEFVFRLL